MVNDYISLNLEPVEGVQKKSFWRVSINFELKLFCLDGILLNEQCQ